MAGETIAELDIEREIGYLYYISFKDNKLVLCKAKMERGNHVPKIKVVEKKVGHTLNEYI